MSVFIRGKIMKRVLSVAVGVLLFIGIMVGIITVLANIRRFPPSTVITSTECDPPCWYGIWPGETTPQEAIGILVNLDLISDIGRWPHEPNFKRETPELSRITWTFIRNRTVGDIEGCAYIQDDRVIAISLSTLGALTISDAFERLGEPELVLTRVHKSDYREWVRVILIYPADGYQVEVDVNLSVAAQDNQVEIAADTPVYRVQYFDPSQYEYLIGWRILIDGLGIAALDNARSWQGLGRIIYEMR
jgi:hypothetical protein